MLGEQKNNLGPSPDGYIDIVGEGRETSVGHSQGTVSRPAVEGAQEVGLSQETVLLFSELRICLSLRPLVGLAAMTP